jgi:hypothetical protein
MSDLYAHVVPKIVGYRHIVTYQGRASAREAVALALATCATIVDAAGTGRVNRWTVGR